MVPFRKGADGVVARKSRFEMHFETFACERPPRLRRFGGFAPFINAAATPPYKEGSALTMNRLVIRSLFAGLLFVISLEAAGAATVGLIDAIKAADRAAIRGLLQQRIDVNAAEPDGATALHWAARTNDLQTVEMLIRAGANVKAANRYGVTPLYLACTNGNAAMIELLLKAGADPNTALPEGETALMTAARSGNVEAVNTLVAHGADINRKETWRGQTALMWAAAEGHSDVIRALLAHGGDIHARSNGGFTPLLFAVREGRMAAVKALLEAGADLNESLPLRQRGGGTPDKGTETGINAFMLAVGNVHYELAAFLLEKGADPNSAPQGFTALHQISWLRRPGTGDNNPAPQGSGNMDSLEFVRKLVAHGANVNARATRQANMGVTVRFHSIGATPFLLAARTADVQLMRLLLELGADPLQPNEDGTTPLMAAAGVGTNSPLEEPGTEPEVMEAVKLVLGLGGDINTVDKNGDTSMHGAAHKHVPSVIRFLAEKGAKIQIWNQPNNAKQTPLQIAEGVQVGMNIVNHAPTAATIREVMSAPGATDAGKIN
jgi:ankyrin repeat protein